MLNFKCNGCLREEIPVRDGVLMNGGITCTTCFDKEHLKDEADPRKEYFRLSEFQACALCAKRVPEVNIKDMGGSPVCIGCSQNVLSRPFPTWVKAFFAGVLLLVVFSIVWNWRFFQGYHALSQLDGALVNGDLDQALMLGGKAHAALPEVPEITALDHYFNGIRLMQLDSSRQAFQRLSQAHEYQPGMFDVVDKLEEARLGMAFDDKEYDTFLRIAKQRAKAAPFDPMKLGTLSSALACKYVVTGDTAYRDSSRTLIGKALDLSPSDTVLLEYTQRLEHRLATREIIDHATYLQRYPNGWKP